ncbi:MAG: efflux RND transporter periplasmic adaptor subunit [Calditrichaeota bacterium]|nr:efflux RND transporter periplasmic adaptor subunit [Calditrichota bacterium]
MQTRVINLLLTLTVTASLLTIGCAGDDSHSEDGKNSTAKSKDEIKEDDKKNKSEGEDSKREEDLIPVETTVVTVGDISSFILLSSNLETEKMTDIYSRVQGIIEKIFIEEGDYVKKGQLLLQLEPDELAFREAKAKVDYEQEKNLYERKKAMSEKQLLSKEEFEMAKFSVAARKLLWQEAKLNLNHTRITAPISGVVGERLRRPGDRIQPSDKLFTVINNDEMIAVIHVPEKEIGVIKKGQKAFIKSQHLGDDQFAGWIKRVSPVVDPQSGTFKVTVGIDNKGKRLRPGMFVNVHVITDVHRNTVLVPKTAVVYQNENMHVFVVKDNIAKKVTLVPGYQDYEKIESRSGIDPDDKIVVVGQAGLKDGAKVNIVAEQERATEAAHASN